MSVQHIETLLPARTICILFAGPDRRIFVDGKSYWFEMHRYCGPILLNEKGDGPAKNQRLKSPFWHAVSQWAQQGEQADQYGFCIYDPSIPLSDSFGIEP